MIDWPLKILAADDQSSNDTSPYRSHGHLYRNAPNAPTKSLWTVETQSGINVSGPHLQLPIFPPFFQPFLLLVCRRSQFFSVCDCLPHLSHSMTIQFGTIYPLLHSIPYLETVIMIIRISVVSWKWHKMVRTLTQFNDMLIHFLNCQMKNFPQIHFSEFAIHFLREYPCGHCWTFYNLCL